MKDSSFISGGCFMNKKISALVAIVLLVSAVFVSCASAPKDKKTEAPVVTVKPVIGKEGIPQPEWVNKIPKSADSFYAVGYGNMTSKQNSIMRAEADAKDQIARWVGTSVKNALTNYTNESGSGTNKQVLDYMESISKQVADQTLVGVERDESWVDPDGAVYVLCSFPKANVGKGFQDTVQSFQRNEAAAFADFKAKEALSFLDKETSGGVPNAKAAPVAPATK
jgi:hypothetical protein